MKLNLLESVLLGLLARRPSAGYDVRKFLEREGRVFGYTPQSSQIYRQLSALVARGLLGFEIDSRRLGPDAKVYFLTGAGWAALLNWVGAPFVPSQRPLDAHFQLHFTFAGAISPVLALQVVETELAFRLDQESNSRPVGFAAARDLPAPFDPDWAEEVHFLGDARGNQLALVHISWLRTTRARLERYIERHDSRWPDPRWVRLAKGASELALPQLDDLLSNRDTEDVIDSLFS
ncbi:PadR family transcriptional regulator [Microbacteriaceae bacterium VKM Ac-2855]|nr:PadR family transcriptional regulator [Microbacteriaceae bacterium VKM Ac-2855]